MPEKIKQNAKENADRLRERWETILAWAYDATHDESADASENFELGPRKRFRAAMAAKMAKDARQAAEQEAERLRVEAERREVRQRAFAAERNRAKLETAKRRRRSIEELRRRPPRVEPESDKWGEKSDAWEPEF
ncbi:hypothetical protein ACFSYH_10440 [Populibacterium corticicola]|uniref:Uncharacterized protein n=1 Tax=Populibacterium corticicola TaxID=1812826 RepID=A0ABW5XI74_9MICO